MTENRNKTVSGVKHRKWQRAKLLNDVNASVGIRNNKTKMKNNCTKNASKKKQIFIPHAILRAADQPDGTTETRDGDGSL